MFVQAPLRGTEESSGSEKEDEETGEDLLQVGNKYTEFIHNKQYN